MSGRTHFVMVEKACHEFLTEFLPALTTATWQRGPHATSDVVAEATVPGYGVVEGTWYESTGKFRHKYLTVKFAFEGEDISFTLTEHEAPTEIGEVAKRVRVCVGPAVALGAVIARQSESRRSGWR